MIKVLVFIASFLIALIVFSQKPKLVADLNKRKVHQSIGDFTRFKDQLVFLYKEANQSSKILSFNEKKDVFDVLLDLDSVPERYKVQNISATSDFLFITITHLKPAGHDLPDGGYYNVIWASNGKSSGTYQLFGQYDSTLTQTFSAKVVNDRFFFMAKEDIRDKKYTLWTSDGSVSGTIPTKNLFKEKLLEEYHFPVKMGNSTYLIDQKNKRIWKTNKRFDKLQEINYFIEDDFKSYATFNSGLIYSTYSKVDSTCSGWSCTTKSSLWFASPHKRQSIHLVDHEEGKNLTSLHKLGDGVLSIGTKKSTHGRKYVLYFDAKTNAIQKIEIPRSTDTDWAIVDDKYYTTHAKYKDSIKYLYSFDPNTRKTATVDSVNIHSNNIFLRSNSELYFTVSNAKRVELGRYDLKRRKLNRLPNLTEQNSSINPVGLVTDDRQLFFTGSIGNRTYLFVTKGAKSSIESIETGLKNPISLVTINDHLIIKDSNNKLFSYSFSDQSIYELPSIDSTHYRNGYPDNWTLGNTVAFFTTIEPSGKYVWQTDGTVSGTKRIFNIPPNKKFMEFEHFKTVGDTIYFSEKLIGWKTSRLFKIGKNGYNSSIFELNMSNDFYVRDIVNFRDQIYYLCSSPEENGIFKLGDLTSNQELDWANKIHWINYIFATDSLIYLAARDVENRRKLWVFNGTDLTLVQTLTKSVTDVREAPVVRNFNYSQGNLYFTIQDTKEPKTSLWVTRGDSTTTRRILTYDDYRKYRSDKNFSSIGWFRPDVLKSFAIGGKLYFKLYQPDLGKELWVSDGTPEGTKLLMDINPGEQSSDPKYFLSTGNSLFFSADDGLHGTELWEVSLDIN